MYVNSSKMDAYNVQKNMFIKNKYMVKKFGRLKSVVYRLMQYKLWYKNIVSFYIEITLNGGVVEKFRRIKKTCEYLYSTRDVWVHKQNYLEIFKNMMFKYARKYYDLFPLLVLHGYLCPYIQDNGKVCGERCQTEGLCNRHNKRVNIIKERLFISLPKFPKDIYNIVSVYALPIRRD